MKQLSTYNSSFRPIIILVLCSLFWTSAVSYYYYAMTNTQPLIFNMAELEENESNKKEKNGEEEMKDKPGTDVKPDFSMLFKARAKVIYSEDLTSLYEQETVNPPPELI